MQTLLKQVFLIILLSGVFVNQVFVFSQKFEGEILFAKETSIDTSFYAYKIKEDLIRVEFLDKKFQMINYSIINVSQKTILAVNPNRKLYVEIPVHLWKSDKDSVNYKIIKSDNYQIIKGYKCFQWRVQNKKEDTEFSFWVCKDFYSLFSNYSKINNSSDKSNAYFLNITDTDGFFPMLIVERSLLREMRMQSSVISIIKRSLPPSLFEIPADYRLFQKN